MPSSKAMACDEEYTRPRQTLPPAALRTPSFSPSTSSRDSSFGSSSSLSSYEEVFSPFTPPMASAAKGIPFSWERIPGIPKRHRVPHQDQPSAHLLPLPPAGNPNSATKKATRVVERDPFKAALVACSKDDSSDHHPDDDDDDHGSFWKEGFKITRSLSDRFGFINMYASCKRTCAVSESIVHLGPRSSPRRSR